MVAIERGNLVHRIMSEIQVASDVDEVIEQFMESGQLSQDQSDEIKPLINTIVNHEILRSYFTSEYTIYNERTIIDSTRGLIRPDRVVSNKNMEFVIIDYKTGDEKTEHRDQIESYAGAIGEMGGTVKNKFLVYIDEAIHIKEV